MFILNLSDDLFEDVFDRDQPTGPTIFVDHDRHVNFASLKVAKKVLDRLGLRYPNGLPEKSIEPEVRRVGPEVGNEVFDVQNALDVVEVFAVDRNSGMTRFNDDCSNPRKVVGELNALDLGSGSHHRSDFGAGEVHHVLKHLCRRFVQVPTKRGVLNRSAEPFSCLVLTQIGTAQAANRFIHDRGDRGERSKEKIQKTEDGKRPHDEGRSEVVRQGAGDHAHGDPEREDRDQPRQQKIHWFGQAVDITDEKFYENHRDGNAQSRPDEGELRHQMESPAKNPFDLWRLRIHIGSTPAAAPALQLTPTRVLQGKSKRAAPRPHYREHDQCEDQEIVHRESPSLDGVRKIGPTPIFVSSRSSSACIKACAPGSWSSCPIACKSP